MKPQDLDFFEVIFIKKQAGKTLGKNGATKLPKNVGVLYCGGGLLICPESWHVVYLFIVAL
jgi:hypothetical protein